MGRVVFIDGVFTPPEHAVVSVYDRGFLYGDAVFEVLRTYGGVPFAMDEHVARLRRSAERIKLQVPRTDAALSADVQRAIAAAGRGEWYARIMLTRGTGPLGLDIDLASKPLTVILVEEVHPPPRALYEEGARLATVSVGRTADGTGAAGAKVTNYLVSMLALHEAKTRGAVEALIVDGRGDVVEGASSNVFIVRGGCLFTPPVEAGILEGITRAHVLAAAAELGISVQQTSLVPADLFSADEVFVTSSIREVLPATVVDDRRIGDGRPGPLTRALHAAFRRRAGASGKMPWES